VSAEKKKQTNSWQLGGGQKRLKKKLKKMGSGTERPHARKKGKDFPPWSKKGEKGKEKKEGGEIKSPQKKNFVRLRERNGKKKKKRSHAQGVRVKHFEKGKKNL